MAHARPAPEPMKTPKPRRRGVLGRALGDVLLALVRPRGSRAIVLGVLAAVAGICGGVRTVQEGGPVREAVLLLLIGVAGTGYACAAVRDAARGVGRGS
ncbi:hypothetical protein [Streptomyces axinellae]|uniref:hypothetical protein n=1 Tax=Streptomyces axinellae TaxID=552788 RepID=UPI0031DCFADE